MRLSGCYSHVTLLLTEGDLTDFLSTSTPCWPCRQAVSFLCVLWETCLTSSRRFSTWQERKEAAGQAKTAPPSPPLPSHRSAPRGLKSEVMMTMGGAGRRLAPGARQKCLLAYFWTHVSWWADHCCGWGHPSSENKLLLANFSFYCSENFCNFIHYIQVNKPVSLQ